MRVSVISVTACFSISLTAVEAREFQMAPDFDFEAHYAALAANPPNLTKERLPKGYKIGRCLLVVDGQTRISGPCAYYFEKGGDFHITGPRQVYDGIDYPKAKITAAELSTDYWASVFKGDDGIWAGYGNKNISSVHGEGPNWLLERHGACFVGDRVRACLWRS